jgi:chromate transporter
MSAALIALALIFGELSLLAFGGGVTVLPEMQRQVVDVHHWMSAQDFSAMFALAQAAPGPNMMIATLVGWHVAGLPGVLMTSLAKFGPSSLVTGLAMHVWERFKTRPWRRVVQAGLVPIAVGLVTSSAALITTATARDWILAAIVAVTATVTLTTRISPLWMLAAGAIIGLTGLGQG